MFEVYLAIVSCFTGKLATWNINDVRTLKFRLSALSGPGSSQIISCGACVYGHAYSAGLLLRGRSSNPAYRKKSCGLCPRSRKQRI